MHWRGFQQMLQCTAVLLMGYSAATQHLHSCHKTLLFEELTMHKT